MDFYSIIHAVRYLKISDWDVTLLVTSKIFIEFFLVMPSSKFIILHITMLDDVLSPMRLCLYIYLGYDNVYIYFWDVTISILYIYLGCHNIYVFIHDMTMSIYI